MPEEEFLTVREVAEMLRLKPRRIYALAAKGALPCRRATGRLLFPKSELERWLAGAAASGSPGTALPPADILAGSHDPLLEWALRESGSGIASFFDGSLDGLVRFREGRAAAVGLHLLDVAAGEWNLPAVRRELAGRPVVVLHWAWREQGLLFRPELHGRIRSLGDIRGLTVVPRQPQSGAWHLFRHLLERAGLDPQRLDLLAEPARTESEVALAIASGKAEVGFGLRCLAAPFDLAFLPLIRERFDLALHRWAYFEPPWQRLWRFAAGPALHARAAELGGYEVRERGRVLYNERA